MGSEGKSKEEMKKRRRTPSYDSDGKGEKDMTVEDRKSKRFEKDKSSHESSKHHSDKEKKVEEKCSKDKGHKHYRPANIASEKVEELKFRELSDDDYYSKNNEFAMWLKEEENVFFSDLSSDSAHDLFSLFIKDWNNQKLRPQYYEGIDYGPRTGHDWKIKQ